MRYLPLLLLLSGCFGPVMKPSTTVESEPLITIKGDGVNTGKKPPVTRMEMIKGDLYIY